MYYYYATILNGQIDIHRGLTAEEYNTLNPHIEKLSKLLFDQKRIDAMLLAHTELMAAISNLSERHDLSVAKSIQYKLSQYLFEFKKFLDNWETDIKRKFGKNSTEFSIFKKSQSEEFDNHMEYRIMYRLRNYDQHCGDIISNITGYIDGEGKPAHRILVNRDNLLQNFSEWKQPEVDFLKGQEEQFEIFPYISQLHNSILRIYEKTMQIHVDQSLLDSCVHLITVANEFENEDNTYVISTETEITKDYFEQDKVPLNFTYLVIPVCKKILVMQFKNNAGLIKVLYRGSAFKNKLSEFAFEINTETAEKITASCVLNLCGQKLIRYTTRINFDTGDIYALCIDARIKHVEQKNIGEKFSSYLKALCKG